MSLMSPFPPSANTEVTPAVLITRHIIARLGGGRCLESSKYILHFAKIMFGMHLQLQTLSRD